MLSASFLNTSSDPDCANQIEPVAKELMLLTPALCQRVDRVLKLQDDNLDKANQLLGEVKGHLAFRKAVNSHIGLDRHYHLLMSKKTELARFAARLKYEKK